MANPRALLKGLKPVTSRALVMATAEGKNQKLCWVSGQNYLCDGAFALNAGVSIVQRVTSSRTNW